MTYKCTISKDKLNVLVNGDIYTLIKNKKYSLDEYRDLIRTHPVYFELVEEPITEMLIEVVKPSKKKGTLLIDDSSDVIIETSEDSVTE